MKKIIKKIYRKLIGKPINEHFYIQKIYERYKDFTMLPETYYIGNLKLCERYKNIAGCVVECGVWKGGMIAGIADLLGVDRDYYLFDSFEGLPLVQEIDGEKAKTWQENINSAIYYNNCKADIEEAKQAMLMAGIENPVIIKGWFDTTLANITFPNPIAIFRLDADWYHSTHKCLEKIYPFLLKERLIIIDDYYT